MRISLAFLVSAIASFAQNPYLQTITPSAVAAGGPSFQMTALGTSFEAGAVIQWNGASLPSTVVSVGQLTATVAATLIASPGTVTINVLSNGHQSNPLEFSITSGAPPAVISSLSPLSAIAGGPQFTLDVSGSGFVSSSVVQWNGTSLPTSYGSATNLTAAVPAALIVSAGYANITVANPGGSTSAAAIYPISACDYGTIPLNQPFPASVAAGGPAFTVEVTTGGGDGNFFRGAVVEWNGSPLATTFQTGDSLVASVPASLIANPGVANISVTSNSPCETSTVVTLAIIAATTISSVSPSSATAGGPAFTLTVNGTGFVSGSNVLWNGSALATTYVGATQLTALVPATLIGSPGSASLSVQAPGGTALGALPFTITGPTPVISTLGTSLTTSSIGQVYAGGAGFTLTVNGTGFLAGDSILWNGSALTTTYVNPTQLTAPVSASLIAGAGDIAITVQSPSGASNAAKLVLVPTMTSLSPTSIPVSGPAFTLTVNGAGFQTGATLTWQTTLVYVNLPATIVSSTQMTVSVSASLIATPAAVIVLVRNPDGYITSSLGFTITGTLAPVISTNPGFVVAGGPAFSLALSGSNFVPGDTVLWNGSALPTTYGSATYLTAAVPASLIVSPGTASIVVQDPSGRNSNPATLTIQPPSISSLSPSSVFAGSPALTLMVSGTAEDYFPGTAVQWNGAPLTTTYQNSSGVSATVPASLLVRPGTASVTVMNPGGATSASSVFSINTPSIASLNPSSATAGGPAFMLAIGGTGFLSGSTVQWNGSPLTSSDAFGLTAAVPANLIATPGTANITVLQPGGFVTNAAVFTITSPTPVISSLSPASVTAGSAGVTLLVSGSGFLPASTVSWNGAILSTTYVNGNALNATIPANLLASAGTASVVVVNPGGASSAVVSFTIAAPNPSVGSWSPTSATAGGPAFTLTVNGSGFVAGSTVQWNGSALATSYVTATQLTAVVPASAIASQGSVEFEVVNPNGSASGFSAFTIGAALPAISSVNPSSTTAGGAQFTLTIYGSGFLPTSTAMWNGSVIPTTYISASQLTAVIVASLISNSGTANVTVVNPGGGASKASVFTINPQVPIISSLVPNSATAGGPAFTLIVEGSGFSPNSMFHWEGSSVPATYVSGNQLTVAMPASFLAQAGVIQVAVVSAGLQSNAATFTVNAPGSGSSPSIITASSLPSGAVGVPYVQTVTGSGGVVPYKSWAVVDPNDLPPGISLNAAAGSQTAQLAGTPTAAGTFTFTVVLTDGVGAAAANSFTLTIQGSAVSISAAGIVNAASYAGGGVSPGEIVTIFGSGFGPATLVDLQLNSQGDVSNTLANAQIQFDGVAAPLIYVVAGQLSAVVPYAVSGKVTTQVQVMYQGQTSNTVSMPVSETVPGIFTADASGRGQGAIVNQDGTVNTAANPASRGSYIAVYATGEGQTSPGGIDGQPAGSPAPQPVAQPVTATVGGLAAPVTYAGGVPGFVEGFLQVNIQIPPGVSTGASVPIVITIGGQTSQASVTLAIQ